MGKQVTVLNGFSSVRGPSPTGYKAYNAGDTIVYTDTEYAALGQTDLRALSSPPVDVADPARPATDPSSKPVSVDDNASGNVTAVLGANRWTLTGNITLAFPSGTAVDNESEVELYLTQDATGGRTLTLPASAKAAGGTDPVLSTAAGALDLLVYRTIDGGATWVLTNSKLAIA